MKTNYRTLGGVFAFVLLLVVMMLFVVLLVIGAPHISTGQDMIDVPRVPLLSEEKHDSNPPTIEAVYFRADWCKYCRQVEPVVQQLQREGFPVRVMDLDSHKSLAEYWHVDTIPRLVVAKFWDRQDGTIIKAQQVDQLRYTQEQPITRERIMDMFARYGIQRAK